MVGYPEAWSAYLLLDIYQVITVKLTDLGDESTRLTWPS
jgi:hypothetical protein